MNPLPSKIQLTCYWSFQRNELVVGLPDAYLATVYQDANPEGRIYSSSKSEEERNEVYLPRPDGIICLRSSSQGQSYSLVLQFAMKGQAEDWHKKALIGSMFPDRSATCVYINREIRSELLVPVPHVECLLPL